MPAKKCTKTHDARAELLFCLFNLLEFLTFSFLSPSWHLAVPHILIMILLGQVLDYHLPKKVLLSCHLECRFVLSNRQIFGRRSAPCASWKMALKRFNNTVTISCDIVRTYPELQPSSEVVHSRLSCVQLEEMAEIDYDFKSSSVNHQVSELLTIYAC